MKHTKTYAAALAHEPDGEESFEQSPESVVRSSTKGGKTGYASMGGASTSTISPPKTLDEEFELYQETGFIASAIHQYADDTTMPGVRVSADNEETEKWLNEKFLPQAGIVGGQRHQEFSQFLYQDVIQFLAGGNILDENVKDSEGRITGFLHINPASCKAETEPNKPILRSPDAVDEPWFQSDWPVTERGEAAAFTQYHNDSPLGKKGQYKDRDEIPLSLNDVTYRPRTPPAGQIWGIPITRNIKQEVTEFVNIRKDLARAIRTKAWGIWSVAFDTEVIETKDEVIIEGWEADEMDSFTSGLGSMDPGEIVGHDGSISFEKHQGEVPEEVLDVLESYVKLIVSALPPPLYAVGFEDNINQFVVKEQEQIYEASVRSMQQTLKETWTPTLREVCISHGKDPSGVQLELEPEEDESPIRSMETDDMEKFALFADGLSSLLGQDAYKAFRPEQFADLVTQLPEEAFKSEAFVGVPGGVPQDVEMLPILDELERNGGVQIADIESLRSRLESKTSTGKTPASEWVNEFREITGGGGGIFGNTEEGDEQNGVVNDEGDGQRVPERNPDGTLDGSN